MSYDRTDKEYKRDRAAEQGVELKDTAFGIRPMSSTAIDITCDPTGTWEWPAWIKVTVETGPGPTEVPPGLTELQWFDAMDAEANILFKEFLEITHLFDRIHIAVKERYAINGLTIFAVEVP